MNNQPISDFDFSTFQRLYMEYLSTCTVSPELTDADQAELDVYNKKMEELNQREPSQAGDPASPEWGAWNKEKWVLVSQYSEVICKAMAVNAFRMLGQKPTSEISEDSLVPFPEVSGEFALLDQSYLILLNSSPTNTLAKVGPRRMQKDQLSGKATYEQEDGQKVVLENFLQVISHLGTPTKKLLDVGIFYMTEGNFYRGGSVVPQAVIPLMDYWRAQGLPVDAKDDSQEELTRAGNYIKYLKNNLRQSLKTLESIRWEGYKGTGKNKSQIASYHFVSSWELLRGNRLKITFDFNLAKYLIHAYQMQFPTVLLRHENRNPNAYAIGRKIALHHSMDSNAAAGTENTLSVRSLLDAAPDIPPYETVMKSDRKWKKRIKGVLEAALDANVAVGYLERWEYRDTHSSILITYDAESASNLTWEQYCRLMVDFVILEEPMQEDRRARRALEQAQAAELPSKKKQAKKRGRPSTKKADDQK